MTVVRSQSVRQAHNLQIDLAAYNSSSISIISADDSNSSSSGRPTPSASSHESSSKSSSKSVLFSVLCLHDYHTDEESGLSFRKNEILQILNKESSGWWAARRKGNREIGWIPQAFVAQLAPELVERYETMREEIRCYEYTAEKLYAEAPISRLNLVDDSDVDSTADEHSNIGATTTKVTRPLPPHNNPNLSRTKSRDGLQASPLNYGIVQQPSQGPAARRLPQPPPSPSSPMPHPPPQSAPLYNKPVPPLPLEATRNRAGSESLSSRSIRRRPLILDDNTALSRLSTLIETKNTREIDRYANPDIVGSMHALSKRSRTEQGARAKGRALQTAFHILDKPWYILPAHSDELELDKDGHVRRGSLLALVERLTSDLAFLDSKHPGEPSFASIFLMTFRTFTSSDELFDLLLDRFSMTRPDTLNDAEVEDWKKRCLLPTQRCVLNVFTLWLEDHRLLEEDRHIAQRLPDFVTHVAMPRLPSESQALMHTFERLTFADPIRPPIGLTPKKPSRRGKAHRNELLKLDPSDVAEQLTLYESNRYSKITPRECLAYVHTRTGKSVANLEAFCRTYDQLVGWVKLSILNNDAIAKRATTIDFWIKVAEKCRQMQNFVSMSAILSALSSTVISRLLLTWAHVGRKSQLETLAKHNEPTGGFSAYRSLLASVEVSLPCVPFITMYLTDIVRVREQYSDESGRICFFQRQRWHEIIYSMLKFQRRPYYIPFEESITTFIHNHLKEGGSKDNAWFWNRSQQVQQAELTHADIRKGLEQAGF